MKRTRTSWLFELREMPLSFQTGLNLVNVSVVSAIQESISGLEPFSDTAELRYLKLVTVLSFRPFTLISLLILLVSFVINLLFSALISMPQSAEALS